MTYIALVLSIVAVIIALTSASRQKQRSRDAEANLETIREALQDVGDKVDADYDLLKVYDERSRNTAASLSLQLVGLAKAVGYELKDGFWNKIVAKKTVAKTASNVAKPVTKKGGSNGKH